MTESFQPISVKDSSKHPWLFKLRCLIDLQLYTIIKYLHPELKKLEGNILDVGAGEAPWCGLMPENINYQGIDIDNSVDFGMINSKKNITYYDGKVMPFADHSFDTILCIEVLEHTPNPTLLLSEISRVLAPNGTLLLTVPWSARRHHIPYDFYRFSREALNTLLLDHGFTSIEISERGSDILVIANKIIILNLRLVLTKSKVRLLWTLPLALLLSPITIMFLLIGHITEFFGLGAKEDPLGYFIKASK